MDDDCKDERVRDAFMKAGFDVRESERTDEFGELMRWIRQRKESYNDRVKLHMSIFIGLLSAIGTVVAGYFGPLLFAHFSK